MESNVSILCTGEPGEGGREMASQYGIDLDIVPFTEIRFRDEMVLRQRVEELAREEVDAVVTSRNGLKGLLNLLPEVVGRWRLFCLGNYSKEFVNQRNSIDNIEAIWAEVSGADELADVAIAANVKKVVFFCGDQRMDILPQKLTNAGVEVEEIVIYDTVSTPSKLDATFSGVVFYSPAVVRSFFEVNNVPDGAVSFAIGKSTAAELARHGVKHIVVAERPGKMKLLELACVYFAK
ncbi:MAG: uroporphyrinogen-III synthase [Taibaiella sp.]|nr:uroporphyrinogen-III synthase [Taibaiella sp.]